MAFLRNKSFALKQFIPVSICSSDAMWTRNKSFHHVLPKFPFPSGESLSRHQLVKPRQPPIPPESASSGSTPSNPQKKHVDFLRDDCDDEEETVAAVKLPSEHQLVAKPSQKLAEKVDSSWQLKSISELKTASSHSLLLADKTSSSSSSSLTNSKREQQQQQQQQLQQKQQQQQQPQQQQQLQQQQQQPQQQQQELPKAQELQQQQQQELPKTQELQQQQNQNQTQTQNQPQRKQCPQDAYFERVKIQNESMQKAQDHKHHQHQHQHQHHHHHHHHHSDKKVNVHLENGKVHQRIHKLMQLQQQMDDTEPTPFTPQKLRNYQFGQSRHRRSGVHNFDDMRPPRASTYTHPVYGARVKQVASDTQAYTPAHKDSDNGDIFAKSRAQAIMMRQSKSEQFPSKRTARPIGGESAMYRLCKGLLLRNVISKY